MKIINFQTSSIGGRFSFAWRRDGNNKNRDQKRDLQQGKIKMLEPDKGVGVVALRKSHCLGKHQHFPFPISKQKPAGKEAEAGDQPFYLQPAEFEKAERRAEAINQAGQKAHINAAVDDNPDINDMTCAIQTIEHGRTFGIGRTDIYGQDGDRAAQPAGRAQQMNNLENFNACWG